MKVKKIISEIVNAKIPVRVILLLILSIPLTILCSWFLGLILQPHFFIAKKIGDFIEPLLLLMPKNILLIIWWSGIILIVSFFVFWALMLVIGSIIACIKGYRLNRTRMSSKQNLLNKVMANPQLKKLYEAHKNYLKARLSLRLLKKKG